MLCPKPCHTSIRRCFSSFIQELLCGRPAAAFRPISYSQRGSVPGATGLVQQRWRLPFQDAAVASSVRRSTGLLEDKELARDLTYDRQQLLSQQHVTAACAVNVNLRIDEYHIRFPKLEHAREHH